MKSIIEERTGLKLKEVTGYEVGKTYYNGYWNTTFTVLDILPSAIWGEKYKCLWKDGRITTHSTGIDVNKDFEVIRGNI